MAGKLFVGSLPSSCTQEELQSLFGGYGTIINIHVMRRQTQSGAICAFVEMADSTQAQSAIDALNLKTTIPPHSSPITVAFANANKPTQPTKGMYPFVECA